MVLCVEYSLNLMLLLDCVNVFYLERAKVKLLSSVAEVRKLVDICNNTNNLKSRQ